MTKIEAVKAYLKVSKDLMRLHSKAADHISRKDNNKIFELSCRISEVADRILKEYDLPTDDPYFKS